MCGERCLVATTWNVLGHELMRVRITVRLGEARRVVLVPGPVPVLIARLDWALNVGCLQDVVLHVIGLIFDPAEDAFHVVAAH